MFPRRARIKRVLSSWDSSFLYLFVWRKSESGDRFEIWERQSGDRCESFSVFSQFTDNLPLHRRFHLSRRDIPVSRNSLTCYTARHLRIRRLILFIFAGAVYYNALTNCATRSCCACLDEITCVADRYLTLRTGYEKHGRKNPLPFPIFEAVTYRKFAPD